MATPLEPKQLRTPGIYGLIRPAEVDDGLIPAGAVTGVQNFNFDRKGAGTVRPGATALGSTVAAGLLPYGLHNAQAGTAVVVFASASTAAIYSYNGSVWSVSLDDGTSSAKVRFVDFSSFTIAIGFQGSIRFWNAGSSRHWHFTGNPINPQHLWNLTPKLGEVYKSRVYLSGDTSTSGNPSRLLFSSVISTAGVITFSPTLDFVDINPGDGENITALKRYATELEVFKPNYLYRFRTSGTDPDPLIKIGTRSQEAVVEGSRGLYFPHDSGFYRYTEGGYPEIISRSISDIFSAIPFTQLDDIIGWTDPDHLYWSVGNLTITESGLSETIKNVVLRYTESSDLWTVYSYPWDIRRAITYTTGSQQSRIAALDNGVVTTLNSGVMDMGEPIKYYLRTKWENWGTEGLQKVIQEILVMMEKSQGAEIFYQTDENPEWNQIGQMTKMVNMFDKLNITFHRIRFKVSGVTRYESTVFRGIDVIQGLNEGIVE